MEDSNHSSGRGAQRNICRVISHRKKSLFDDWSFIPPAQVYTSGCLTDREWAGPLSSDTEYCYCQEDRCNGQLQGDTVAEEETIKANNTDNATSLKDLTDSLPHPINSQLFYNLMKSGSSELIFKASFMTLCILHVAKLL